jgi:GNAT superfamily N-acetyltransferase
MEEITQGRKILVRLAKEEDNTPVLELSPRCVQRGMITMYPDRAPVFNQLHRLLDPESYHMVAIDQGKVIGLLGTLHTDFYFRGAPYRTAYFMDFKVDPDYRRGLTAFRMVRQAIDRERESGTRLALATLLKNNEAPMAFTKGRGGFPVSLYLGDNRVFSFVPVRRLKTDSRYTFRSATETDIPQLVALYNRFYSTYRLAPRITEELLIQYMTRIEGLDPGCFLLALEDERIKAVVAAWDAKSLKRYRVTRANFKVKLISGLVRFLSWFGKMPEPIGINEPLKQLTLVLYAHDEDINALASVFRQINNANLGGDYSLIQLQIHEDDPAKESLKGLTGISVFSEIHLFTDTLQFARDIQVETGPVHLEFQNYI